jgi:hypothetical protein
MNTEVIMRLIAASTWLVLSCIATSALANNNFFLPGDAFFPTVLTAEIIDRLQADRDPPREFEYSHLDSYDFAFCGYAGYRRAKIPAVDDAFVANLAKAYGEIRKHDPRKLIETVTDGKPTLKESNGVYVLFYPKAFEFPRFKLGLQYNEKWADEVVKLGHRQRDIRLCALVDDRKAVEESWRDGALVGTFDVTLPNVKLVPGPPIDEPMTINGAVKALVLEAMPLKEYFEPADSRRVYLVDSSETLSFEREDGEWVVSPTGDQE